MTDASSVEVDTSLLHKATISYDYLHTNSTTHEFLFGALAELVDNARDAASNSLHIDYVNDHLGILDDGCGMLRDEAISVVSFGHSLKKMEAGMIGQYGNGLKSGAMRIAKDFVLFTKKKGVLTCLLLSRSFHEEKRLKEIFVPAPSFTTERVMITDNPDRHSTEMDIIYNYSPFKSQDQLFKQFDRICGESGTLVVLYNLRRIETGDTELDFRSDPVDIKLSQQEDQREPEHNSLRAYLSVLYLNPSMKIYLRGKKVATVRILHTLAVPYRYKYMAKNLKTCAAKQYEKRVKMTREANDMLGQAKSEMGLFNNRACTGSINVLTDKNARAQQRMLNVRITECEDLIKQCKAAELQALKDKNSPAPLMLYYGMNIHHRNRYGCMIYNNGRLIEMYVKTAVQKERNDLMMKCLGVVGLVDVPYSVLEPTHNKQSFENKREYMGLLKAMNEHMEQYWMDIGIGASPGGIKSYWKQFGYDDSTWSSQCNNQLTERVKRFIKTGHSVQCVTCLRWRHIEYQKKYMDEGLPDDWCCNMHPNKKYAGCALCDDVVKAKDGKLSVGSSKAQAQMDAKPSIALSQQKRPNSDASPYLSATINQRNGGGLSTTVVKSEVDSPRNNVPKVGERRSARTTVKPPAAASEDEESEDSEDDGLELEPRPKKRKVVAAAAFDKNRSAKASSPRRSGGAPPMRKPYKRLIYSDDDNSDEEVVPAKKAVPDRGKARTKSDLRKESFSRDDNEEEEEGGRSARTSRRAAADSSFVSPTTTPTPRIPTLRIPMKSAAAKTNGSTPVKTVPACASRTAAESSTEVADPIQSPRPRSDQDPSYLQLQEEKNAMAAKLRQFVSALSRKGSTHATPLVDASDQDLLAADVNQIVNNTWNDLVHLPQRERDDERLLDRHYRCPPAMRSQYANFQDFQEDIYRIIVWTKTADPENPSPTIPYNAVFEEVHSIARQLEENQE